MRTVLTLCIFLLFSSRILAFEGNIQLTKQSQYDTTYVIFYFKDSKVRLDEFTESGQLCKTLLIDLNTENIVALSPSLKLYTDVSRKTNKPKASEQFDVIKTSSYKFIEGKKCYQWRVRNRILESEITYWVMESDNPVMQKLYYILTATENYSSISSFFMQIPESDGFVPLLAVERNLVREQKQSMHITSINEKKIPAKLFEIPKDYKNMKI